MTSSNGNIFRVIGLLWGESAGHWWVPLTKDSDAELLFSLMCVWRNGWAIETQWLETPSRSALWRHCNGADGLLCFVLLWLYPQFTVVACYLFFKVASLVLWQSCDSSNTINTLRPRQNDRHFREDIFNWMFLNENILISSSKVSLKFVPKGLIDKITTLVHIMAWHQTGDKSLSEPMMAWVVEAYMPHLASIS